jgi:hypothetical protein
MFPITIRLELTQKADFYFDYSKYSSNYQSKILQFYLTKMNEIEGFNIENISLPNADARGWGMDYMAKPDLMIEFADKTKKQITTKFIPNHEMIINISTF